VDETYTLSHVNDERIGEVMPAGKNVYLDILSTQALRQVPNVHTHSAGVSLPKPGHRARVVADDSYAHLDGSKNDFFILLPTLRPPNNGYAVDRLVNSPKVVFVGFITSQELERGQATFNSISDACRL